MQGPKSRLFPARSVGIADAADSARVPAGRSLPPVATEPRLPANAPEQRQDDGERDRQMLRQLVTRMAETLDHLHAEQRRPLDALRRLAVDLGVAIARRLVHEKIAADEFGIDTLVRSALERLQTSEPVVVRLNPADVALLDRKLNGDWSVLHSTMAVRITPDAALPRGDCRAETGDVGVWSNVEQQMQQIHQILLEGIPHSAPPA